MTAEIPVGMRSVDLFCIERHTGTTLAIEAKLRDWRRALRQAEAYKFAADVVYLALPEQVISDPCVRACTVAGIGIMAMPKKGKVSRVLPAVPQNRKRKTLSDRALMAVGPRAAFAGMFT